MNCETAAAASSRSLAASSCLLTWMTLVEADELVQRRPRRREAVAVRRRDLAHVEVSMRVDRDPVGCEPHALGLGRAPLGEDGAARVADRHARRERIFDNELGARRPLHRAAELGRVVVAVGTSNDVVRAVHSLPLADEVPFRVEDLRPLVLPVRHVHGAVGLDVDSMRDDELRSTPTGIAERAHEPALQVEPVHASVAVAVSDHQVLPVLAWRGRGWKAERRRGALHAAVKAAPIAGGFGLVGRGNLQVEPPIDREPPDRLAHVVDAVHRVVARDVDAVRTLEDAVAPRGDELTLAIEDHDWRLPTLKREHPVARVDRHAGHVAEGHALRQAAPTLDPAKPMSARADDHSRGALEKTAGLTHPAGTLPWSSSIRLSTTPPTTAARAPALNPARWPLSKTPGSAASSSVSGSGSRSNTSRAAPAMTPARRAAARAIPSTTDPREVLTRVAVGRIRRSSRSPIR